MLELVAACLLFAAEAADVTSPPPVTTSPETAVTTGTEPVAPAAAPADPAAPSPAAAAPAEVAERPAAAPAEPAPALGAPAADGLRPLMLTLSLGLGRAYPGGELAADRPMNNLTSPMGSLRLDAGIRIRPRLILALVLDLSSGGAPGASLRSQCDAADVDCTVGSSRVSLDARYVFTPYAARTWWVGAGLGAEGTGLMKKGGGASADFMPTYSGGLFPRVSGGWERRVNQYFGWGFYAGLSFGAFSEVAMGESARSSIPGDEAGHSWLDLGVRIIAFP